MNYYRIYQHLIDVLLIVKNNLEEASVMHFIS